MAQRPVLHRDDPDQEPLVGNIKATRQDWLNVALDVLVSDGEEAVKVLGLAERMGVSRSSFYWYFKSRQDLLDQLLQHWQDTNPAAMVAQLQQPADTVAWAICNFFKCVVNPSLFSNELDFAVRDWARRSGKVRRVLDQADQLVLSELTTMFERFDYPAREAATRARVLYYMQLGYNQAELNEPMSARAAQIPDYLLAFTGRIPEPEAVNAFREYTLNFND